MLNMKDQTQILGFFGVVGNEAPGTSAWTLAFVDDEVRVFCGTELLGLIGKTATGEWFCKRDSNPAATANNIMNAITNAVGGGLQNTLTTKTKAELRKVMLAYFERAIMAKAPKKD